MVKMVPHEAFACRCAEGDVVLRQSYKPESYGKLYYACPKSKPPKHFGCGFFLWKETRLRELMSSSGAPSTPSYSAGHSTPPSYSSGPSTPPSYSSGPSTPTNYSLRSSRNGECSNCKHLRGKISVLKATMEMHMHPEQHTVNSAALFHEVYNNMGKLDLEFREIINPAPILDIQRQRYENEEQEKMRNRFPLAILLQTTIQSHTRLSLTLSSPHSRARYGHEHQPGSIRALRNCAPTIPFEATPLLSHIGCPIEPRSWDLQSTRLGFPS
ncbi:hypothetical protein Tco_0520832 [Tanacetum coccineum]